MSLLIYRVAVGFLSSRIALLDPNLTWSNTFVTSHSEIDLLVLDQDWLMTGNFLG